MTKQKKVLILGASRYYSKSIEAARNAGYYVIAADRNPQSYAFQVADTFEVCDIVDKESVLAVAQKHDIDGIVPINDYGVPTAAYVARKMELPGVSEETAYLATNKGAMRQRWIETNVPCPKVKLALSRKECIEAIQYIGLPCILKPANGYGGASRGVIVIEEEKDIEKSITFAQQFYLDKSVLVETFVSATYEHSVEVLVVDGEPHILAVSDKIKTPLPFRVDKNVLYPTAVKGMEYKKLEAAVKAAVTTLGIQVGAAHVELATTPQGPILFELGARCGGGGTPEPIVPYITGIPYFVAIVQSLTGDPVENITPKWHKACNYHFLTPAPGKVTAVNIPVNISNDPDVLDFEVFTKPGTQINKVETGLDRSGFIIIGGELQQDVLMKGKKMESEITFTYKSKD
jgi:biotin carboxylase